MTNCAVDISVVVPVYGCPGALPELHRRLAETLEGMDKTFELILVDDACPQNSWIQIERLCAEDQRVIGVKLSRNFGQSRAITAGLDICRGTWVVVMDCDLQDRPETIPLLYAKAQEGYDVVFARRVDRKDGAVTKFLAQMFYKVYGYFTEQEYDSSLCHFSISRRIVIENFCRARENNRDFLSFILWLGFKQGTIDADSDARFEGNSSYSFRRKMRLAGEIITTHSDKPLRVSITIGFVLAGLAFLYLLYTVINYFIDPAPLGYTTLAASIYLMGGLTLISIGVAGIYIGNIFTEVKGRPLYVVAELLNGAGANAGAYVGASAGANAGAGACTYANTNTDAGEDASEKINAEVS